MNVGVTPISGVLFSMLRDIAGIGSAPQLRLQATTATAPPVFHSPII